MGTRAGAKTNRGWEMSNEKEIRDLIRSFLSSNFSGYIVDEFSGGSMRTRPDLALIGDNFIFVEIKSDKDSLTRLENQITDYKIYCDEVMIVLDIKHKLAYIKKFGEFNHRVCVFDDGKLYHLHGDEFKNFHTGHKNSACDIANLLWAEERRQLLRPLGKIPNTREFGALEYCYTVFELNRYAREIIINRWEYLSTKEKRYQQEYSGGKLQSKINHLEHKRVLLEEFNEKNKPVAKNIGSLF